MTARPILLVLPCHSLDDFPTHYEGDEAAGLLAAWTAPWHPTWIASLGESPRWLHVDQADSERMLNAIVLTPTAVASHLPDDFQQTIRDANADRLEHFATRAELEGALAELQRSSMKGSGTGDVDAELVKDFYALGYWYLQIELLARQISYHSNLDEHQFQERAVAAAKHAVANDRAAAQEELEHCFRLLIEERDHYYPVESYLIDLALVADTTKSSQLRRELDRATPVNLWMTGQRLATLSSEENDLCKSLAKAIDDQRLGLVGGEFGELPPTLLSAESLRQQWLCGLQLFQDKVGSRPQTYFRRRFGLTPRLASLVGAFGWNGAVHATLDAGRYPSFGQACSQWKDQSSPGCAILNRVPLDAARAETFLKISLTMGRSMETDYVATACLARWAGVESEWFDDLRRGDKFGLRLGRFATCDDYLQSNHPDVHGDLHNVDQYRSPFLRQAVDGKQSDPLTQLGGQWRRRVLLEAAERTVAVAAGLPTVDVKRTKEVADRIELARMENEAGAMQVNQAEKLWREAAGLIADTVCGGGEEAEVEGSEAAGWLVFNPFSHARRVAWTHEEGQGRAGVPILREGESTVYAVEQGGGEGQAWTRMMLDVPGLGFAWVPAGESSDSVSGVGEKNDSMVRSEEDGGAVLQNEFAAFHISRESGAIASVYDFRSRGNRLSQRLTRSGSQTSRMVCDELKIENDSPTLASIVTHGRLFDGEEAAFATYEQKVSLSRGSRIARVNIKLDVVDPPTGKPWSDYIGCRWAWPNDTDVLKRHVLGVPYETDGERCESPWCFEVDDGKRRTAILTGGLPFHNRPGSRRLDNLLMVKGESSREFELAVGIDLPQTFESSESNWLPTLAIPTSKAAAQSTGWFFHLGSRHVRVTGLSPVWNDLGGACTGMRVRIQEQSGGDGSFRMRGPRPILSAIKTDFVQSASQALTVEDGVVTVPIAANEWTEVTCHW